PVRMLLQPRMVRGALDREVEGDLDAVLLRVGDETLELGKRAELGMDRVVTALVCADRPRAAGIVPPGGERVVASLPIGAADRMDRRQVDDVHAELGEARQKCA